MALLKEARYPQSVPRQRAQLSFILRIISTVQRRGAWLHRPERKEWLNAVQGNEVR
eukprot:UN30484